MNDDFTWRLDAAVIEWVIVVAMLAMLGAVVTRRSLKAYKKRNGQFDAPVSILETGVSEI